MNFKSEESEKKLSGSYYTPKWIANYIMTWILSQDLTSILEPSCGDGVFFNVLSEHNTPTLTVKGFDIDNEAVNICRLNLLHQNFTSEIVNDDFIKWSLNNLESKHPETFDAVVGNPPFIRYQYLEKDLQDRSQELFKKLNIKFSKHTNAWIPFLIASIEFLKPGGKIGMIIPSEILHVLYAKELRKYLLSKCSQIMLIDPEDIWFADTLQGVMILMAEKKHSNDEKTNGVAIIKTRGTSFAQDDPNELFKNADYVSGSFLSNKWTYALLTPEERSVYKRLCSLDCVKLFTDLADVDVGIVTGANNFFLVTDQVVKKYNLYDVAKPMFGRSEHCPGIIYDEEQNIYNASKGVPTNFLHFDKEDSGIKYRDYLKIGEELGLPSRYKCHIRKPWYRVPSVYASPISMLKRSNGMPRLILNSVHAYTTDTAYRITPHEGINKIAMVRCFLNSLTALSAELEGRHYGGGVLELVPSEIEHLAIPYTEQNFIDLHKLNEYVKTHSIDEVIEYQDNMLFPLLGINLFDVQLLQNALHRLKNRRQRIKTPSDE